MENYKNAFTELSKTLDSFPRLVQPINLFKMYNHQQASLFRDMMYRIDDPKKDYFYRKVQGKPTKSGIKTSYTDYLCMSKISFMKLIKNSLFVNTEYIRKKNTTKFYFNNTGSGVNFYLQVLGNLGDIDVKLNLDRKKYRSLCQPWILTKMYGWTESIILSQFLYFTKIKLKKYNSNIFFKTFKDIKKDTFLSIGKIKTSKIWKRKFINITKEGYTKRIIINPERLNSEIITFSKNLEMKDY